MKKEPYSPYRNASGKFIKNTLWWTGAFTIIVMIALRIIDQWLTTPESPTGMIGFELAKDIHITRIMMDSWGEKGRIMAGLSLGIDFLYIVAYSLFLGLSAFAIGKKLEGRSKLLSRPGYRLSWLMLLAGIFDAIENYSLIEILSGNDYQRWATAAYYFSTTKFAIVIITLLYIILGLATMLITKPAKSQPA